MLLICVASTCVEDAEAQQVHLRRVQEASPPNGTSLSASEYEALLGLLGGNDTTQLTSLYRSSVHGTTYGDLLRGMGDAKPFVFVIKKDKYVFGAFINCSIQLPDDPTKRRSTGCRIVWASGREGSVFGAKVFIGSGEILSLGYGGRSFWDDPSADDIRSCRQYTSSDDMPEGYTGEKDEDGNAVLGGAKDFMADEIEVLQVDTEQASLPAGTSLSASEYEGLLGLVGNGTKKLTSLYRASVHGTTYGDLLRYVGYAKPLVLVIKKSQYVFGAFISARIWLPDDPTSYRRYLCHVWLSSLAGHFTAPTKIDIPRLDQYMAVAGREGDVAGANVDIGGTLWLGAGSRDSGRPAADVRRCAQAIDSNYVPVGYMGVREQDGDSPFFGHTLLGGSEYFTADEIEVLHAGQ
ncbi:unnamed protein product [Vitrella brassicaformis CCMP3155]|uniref:Oxidation resistance protein 1 n=1 Tax=Vitrella brassicaformis (strain CCMP3155) TaxID=1169540 RepID=A0A0G4EBJ0_VITBC|nr:unnamed protein product [Vitrella brassicaformis CCMP3155]|eukprot:CEL92663.1 unnamed protein product [Vitrella brassicaformis CCMP3155]